jgi:hypothetical protein
MKNFNLVLAVFYIIVGGLIIFLGPKIPKPDCLVCGGFLEFAVPYILVALGITSAIINTRGQQKQF